MNNLNFVRYPKGHMKVSENDQSGIIRGNASVFGEFLHPGYKKMPIQ
jgi:hypothetical protein